MKPVVSTLEVISIRLMLYLNDMLLIAEDKGETKPWRQQPSYCAPLDIKSTQRRVSLLRHRNYSFWAFNCTLATWLYASYNHWGGRQARSCIGARNNPSTGSPPKHYVTAILPAPLHQVPGECKMEWNHKGRQKSQDVHVSRPFIPVSEWIQCTEKVQLSLPTPYPLWWLVSIPTEALPLPSI